MTYRLRQKVNLVVNLMLERGLTKVASTHTRMSVIFCHNFTKAAIKIFPF